MSSKTSQPTKSPVRRARFPKQNRHRATDSAESEYYGEEDYFYGEESLLDHEMHPSGLSSTKKSGKATPVKMKPTGPYITSYKIKPVGAVAATPKDQN